MYQKWFWGHQVVTVTALIEEHIILMDHASIVMDTAVVPMDWTVSAVTLY